MFLLGLGLGVAIGLLAGDVVPRMVNSDLLALFLIALNGNADKNQPAEPRALPRFETASFEPEKPKTFAHRA